MNADTHKDRIASEDPFQPATGGRLGSEISELLALPSEVSAAARTRTGARFLILLVAISLGVLVGLIDVLLDAYYFKGSGDIVREVLRPSTYEIYIRGMFLVVFVLFGLFASQIIGRLQRSEAQKEAVIAKLSLAKQHIHTLKGILPICSSCKKIRDDNGEWQRFEKYIHEHSGADFTHGYCPDCSAAAKRSRPR